jgi:hypothetical protein
MSLTLDTFTDSASAPNQGRMAMSMAKNTICLWYDKDAEEAARFYAETFPDSAVTAVHRAPAIIPPARQAMF